MAIAMGGRVAEELIFGDDKVIMEQPVISNKQRKEQEQWL